MRPAITFLNIQLSNSRILYNAYDIWYQKGNREPLSCMGDYAIVSNSILEDKIDISSFDEKYTDHPGIIVTL